MTTWQEWKLIEAWRVDDAEWRVPDSPLGWAIVGVLDSALESGEKP